MRSLTELVVICLILAAAPLAAQDGSRADTVGIGIGPGDRAEEPERAILPTAYYTPETNLAFGALWAQVWTSTGTPTSESPRPPRQSSVDLSGSYTLERQLAFSSDVELHPGVDRMVLGRARFAPRWPDRFYPVGNGANRDEYEDWTARSAELRAQVLRRAGDVPLFLGPAVDLRHLSILKRKDGGALDQGSIRGTETHTLVGGGAAAVWDTRDASVWPRAGSFHQASALVFGSLGGGGSGTARFEVDLRRYHSLGTVAVLAVRGRVIATGGPVPFSMHAKIGGTEGGLRGVHQSRFADRASALAVAEIRRPLFWRLGGVAFVGAGRVASSLDGLAHSGFHPAGGAGLRFALIPESGLNVGVDAATDGDGLSVYVTLGEAF